MRDDFVSSFIGYVPPKGDDVRRRVLSGFLESSPDIIIEFVAVYDFAAVLTSVMRIKDVDSLECLRLRHAYEQWNEAQRDVPFSYTYIADVELDVDSSMENLESFLQVFQDSSDGRTYLSQILISLLWANEIDEIRINLWNQEDS